MELTKEQASYLLVGMSNQNAASARDIILGMTLGLEDQELTAAAIRAIGAEGCREMTKMALPAIRKAVLSFKDTVQSTTEEVSMKPTPEWITKLEEELQEGGG